jgi:tetratricopeptide (TPR) repeat protein
LLVLLERQGRFADAEKLLMQVKISPKRASAWQLRAALGLKNYVQAIDALKLRASNDHQDVEARIHLARLIYQETRDADQALAYVLEAEGIGPDSRTLVAVKASILRDEGRKAEARAVLDDYVTRDQGFDAYWVRAVYLTEEGEFDRAEQDYLTLTEFTENSAAGYELLSNFYAQTERLDESVVAVEKGLSATPDHVGLKRMLMRRLLQSDQTQDRVRAFMVLSELEEQLPPDTELMMVRASQLLQESTVASRQRAKEILRATVKLAPRQVEAYLMLIRMVMEEEDYQGAGNMAARALVANPDHPALLALQSQTELLQGYIHSAVELAHKALQEDSNNLEALIVLSEGAQRSGERTSLLESRHLLDAAMVRYPSNERVLLTRAHVLAALEEPQAGTPELVAYIETEIGSESMTAILTLADLYRLAGNAADAQKWLRRAEQQDPKNQAVIHARLLWCLSQERFDDLATISSTYKTASGQDLATVLRAAGLLSEQDLEVLQREGLALFRHAVTLAPMSVDARLGLAGMLYRKGEVDQARKTYEELLESYPDNIRVLNDLAWILQEHDDQGEVALELANRGVRLAPGDLYLRDTRGHILASMPDRLGDARNDFEMLMQLSPQGSPRQAKALFKLGRVCVKLNDLVQAREYLTHALEIDQKVDVFTTDERSEIVTIAQVGTL